MTTFVHASVTAIFMSASTEASKSSASAIPASAWRTTPTPSGRAGMVSRTSGAGPLMGDPRRHGTPETRGRTRDDRWPGSFARAVGGAGGCDGLLAALQHRQDGYQAGDVEDPLDPRLDAV